MGLVISRRFGGRWGVDQPVGCRCGGRPDLRHQAAEMGFFDLSQTAGAILGRKTPGIDLLADEGAIRIAAIGLQFRHGDHLIDDPGQLEPGLRAIDLRLEHLAIEVVEDPDKPDILGPRVLQMGEPADHLAAVQAVSASGWPLHQPKHSRPATVIESTKIVS